MARLTLRLPDSLQHTLAKRAEAEGVSMNQFLVYALTQVAAVDIVADQHIRFQALRSRYTEAEAETALKSLLDGRED